MIHSGKPIRRLSGLSLVMSWTAGLAQQTEQVVSFAAESVFLDLQRGTIVFKNLSVSDGKLTDANSDSWTLADSASQVRRFVAHMRRAGHRLAPRLNRNVDMTFLALRVGA